MANYGVISGFVQKGIAKATGREYTMYMVTVCQRSESVKTASMERTAFGLDTIEMGCEESTFAEILRIYQAGMARGPVVDIDLELRLEKDGKTRITGARKVTAPAAV